MALYEDMDFLSAGHISLPSNIHDPEGDRLRLGRELARDFGPDTFSTNSSRGGNGSNNDTDTLGSFNIARDARGTSTRKADMLQHSPTIDSQLFAQDFADFTMPGRDEQEITDSLEMGRARDNSVGMKSADFSSNVPFSIGGGSGRKRERKLSSFFTAVASPDGDRLQSISSTHSDPSEYLRPSQRRSVTDNRQKENAKSGHPQEARQTGGSLTGFDFSQIELSTPKNNPRGRSRLGAAATGGTGASKITDFVSNSGSGGSRSRFQGTQMGGLRGDDHGDTASDAGSVSGRARPISTRFVASKQRQVSSGSTVVGGTRSARGAKGDDLTGDVPAIVAKARKAGAAAEKAVPKSFKSTDVFLRELGLDGHTTTTDMKARLDNLKDVDPGRAPGLYRPADEATIVNTQQSFLLPQMSDLSELISGHPGDATRFSRKRASGYGSKTHRALDSIPVPHDERAILMAMRLLQDKVADLEGSKAEAERECLKLEFELRRTEARIHQEQQKAKAAEEGLVRKISGDSAFGGSNDGDAEERSREKLKLEHQMERLKLETIINSLRTQLNTLTRELETAKIALKHMQEERNSAIGSIALAISTNQDLKATNEELRDEIEKLRQERYDHERKDNREREEWKSREERLRRKAREAREAMALAEGVIRKVARRDNNAETAIALEAARAERREQRLREKEAQRVKEELEHEKRKAAEEQKKRERAALIKEHFDEVVEQQLRKLHPKLFTSKPDANSAPVDQAVTQQQGRRRRGGEQVQKTGNEANPAGPTSAEGSPANSQGAEDRLEAGAGGGETSEQTPGDETVMSISSEEIRRIAKEINAERRKRKTAAANATHESGEARTQAGGPTVPVNPSNRFVRISAPDGTAEIPAETSRPAHKSTVPKKPTKAVNIAKLDKGKRRLAETSEEAAATVPAQLQPSAAAVTSSDSAVQTAHPSRKSRKRRVKKVVYYYNEDTTMTFPMEEEVEEDVTESEDDQAEASGRETRRQAREQDAESAGDKPDEDMSYEDPHAIQSDNTTSSPASEAGDPPPAPPVDREEHDVQSVVDHLAEHDPESCTVCKRMQQLKLREQEQRNANPLADVDNSMAFPAASLAPVSGRRPEHHGPFEEEPTPRPSQEPRTQLSKVVRQLQDEFAHIKLTYQKKAEEFMSLDPSIGKRRRKALTGEMNELVAEMDYKCDQIYALYDVNEEFEGGVDSERDSSEEEEEEGSEEEEDEGEVTGWTIPDSFIVDEDESDEEGDDRT